MSVGITPEPPPTSGTGQAVWDLVLADIHARDAAGANKYGQRLTLGDGRRSLVDAYQEALDLVVYLRKAIAEAGIGMTVLAIDPRARAERSEDPL